MRVCAGVCVCVCVRVYVMKVGLRGVCVRVWGGGYDHRRTPPGHGFDPHQEGCHILPGWVPTPFRTQLVPLFWVGNPQFPLLPQSCHTHTHARTHTRTPTLTYPYATH